MENNEAEHRLLESEYEKHGSLITRTWAENKLIYRTAFPAILFRLTVFAVYPVTQAFIGHISQVELAAYALVQTIVIRFVSGVLVGMSSATETLCGQAFGAKHYHMMGIYLQRSWIVNLITSIVLLPIFIFATPIFKLLGQEDEIADAVEQISLWFIGLVYSIIFSMSTEMYLQAQRKNMFIGLVSPTAFVIHVILSWAFVSKLNWGINGAMAALVFSRWILVGMILVYVFGGWCPRTWTGFTWEAFHDLVPVVKLSISSGIMLCVQIWYGSILLLLAGYTSNPTVDISALSISLNINSLCYMFCLGFLGATSVRVSNELGKGNAKAAKFSIKITMASSVTFGVTFCVLCLAFGSKIPYLFTSDDEVASVAASLSIPLAFSNLLNSIQVALTGVAVGTGLQAKAAVVNVCSYYLIGVPLGCIFAFVAEYGIMGIWIGLVGGQVVQAIALACLTWRIDWEAEVDKSVKRLNRFLLEQNGQAGLPISDEP